MASMMSSHSDVSTTPITPRRSLLITSNHHDGDPVSSNDDETEKRERLRLKLSDIRQQSPSSSSKRKSMAPNGLSMSGTEMAEHYSNCIKLSTENKITVKNAFNLHLIDYMEAMLQKKDSEMNNFQVASCTLDASAKIYAYRVDSIHAETFKIIGGILRTGGGDKSKKDRQGYSDGDDNETRDNDNKDEATKLKKKKSRKKSTVEQNLKSINLSKFDIETKIDPMFQRMRSAFDEGGTGGLLLNNFGCLDDTCEVVLDSSRPAFSKPSPRIEPKEKSDFTTIIGMLADIVKSGKVICPEFRDFSFTQWDPNDTRFTPTKVPKTPARSAEFAFDPDSVPDPVGNNLFDNDDTNDDMFSGYEDNPSMYIEKQTANRVRFQSDIVELKSKLADEPSDYSYFDDSYLSAWAGPNHWKTKPLSKVRMPTVVGADGAPSVLKKRLPKPSFRVTFDGDVVFEGKKDSSQLQQSTISTWTRGRSTLPTDLHYDPRKLVQLFVKPNVKVTMNKRTCRVVDAVDQYDYDNANDCEDYCPGDATNLDKTRGFFDQDETIDLLSQTEQNFLDSNGNPNITRDVFAGDNLLRQPFKVAKINIQYAKTAKKVNVKKVKLAMWKILTKDEDKCEDSQHDSSPKQLSSSLVENSLTKAEQTCFSEVCRQLSGHVSGQTLENLSVPMAFVCLLYLVNEKSLKLEENEDLTDFIIC